MELPAPSENAKNNHLAVFDQENDTGAALETDDSDSGTEFVTALGKNVERSEEIIYPVDRSAAMVEFACSST
jgi:hypothetical protein